jgi:AcrR family transcriptional regulator
MEGTIRAVGRWGSAVTLSRVAEEVGLTAARMIQRFGSKRGLLLAIVKYSSRWSDSHLDDPSRTMRSPLAALIETLATFNHSAVTRESLPNHFAVMQLYQSDPEFQQIRLRSTRACRSRIRQYLDAAVMAGELVPCNTAKLTQTVMVSWAGCYYLWMASHEGKLAVSIRRSLEAVLEPYRAARPHPVRRAGATRLAPAAR